MKNLKYTFQACPPGQGYHFDFTCSGDGCDHLKTFPGVECTNQDILTCTNGVTCAGTASNFTAEGSFSRSAAGATRNYAVSLDSCKLAFSLNGTAAEYNIDEDTCPTAVPSDFSTPLPTPSDSSVVGGSDAPSPETTWVGLTPEVTTIPESTFYAPTSPTYEASSTSSGATFTSPLSSGTGPRYGTPRLSFPVILSVFLIFFSVLVPNVSGLCVGKDDLTSPRHQLGISRNHGWENIHTREVGLVRRDYQKAQVFRKTLDVIRDWMVDETLAAWHGSEDIGSTIVDKLLDAACNALVYAGEDLLGRKIIMKPFIRSCSLLLKELGLLAGQFELLILLGSDFVCNLIITEFLNEVPLGYGQATAWFCGDDGPCSEDRMSDPNNCGICGRKCAEYEACTNGVCSMDYCAGGDHNYVARCATGDNYDTCYCASDVWGKGFCVENIDSCFGQLTDDCTANEDCETGRVCGMPPGCDVYVCLDAASCYYNERPEGVTPISLPPSPTPTSPPVTQPPGFGTVGSSPTPEPTSDPVTGYKPWYFTLDEGDIGNGDIYSENPANLYSAFEGYLLVEGEETTVNTACLTVFSTGEEGRNLGDGSDGGNQLPSGDRFIFDYDSDFDGNLDDCCLEYYSNEECEQNDGEYVTVCEIGSGNLQMAAASWKVFGCKGTYHGRRLWGGGSD
ncbi:hypothetical protein ABW19_dt0203196 [Dactylella cylindrospora]|nr:hypothetical protein ABW19_dt0203196 [Dactylella cylindrospora]